MLTQYAADAAAMEAYLRQLGAHNSAWYAAFRQAFLDAMRHALTARQYEAIYRHCIEGISQREIARSWGISPAAVCMHIARGKRRLAVLLTYNLELRTAAREE